MDTRTPRTQPSRNRIRLIEIPPEAARAIVDGEPPGAVAVAADYPTEFSSGVAQGALRGQHLGPYFIHAVDDGLVVGEIGGDLTAPGELEIGYAIVASRQNRGYASAAVEALLAHAAGDPALETVVGHTPKDRPKSARVLEKAGFRLTGEITDEHEGDVMRAQRWERVLRTRT